jgi:hypothetical protein
MTADLWTVINTAGSAALDRGPRAGVASAMVKRALTGFLSGLSPERRDAALSLALLWHDDLDGAHGLCQAHEGDQDCDYVHALLHRREGDFANAKYWFREVGEHPVYPVLAQAVAEFAPTGLLVDGRWRPAAMVDACAAALSREQARQSVLMQVQAAEFSVLAAHIVAR